MRPTRLLTGLATMAFLVVGLVALLPDCASACTCAAFPGSEQERAERALAESTAVFSGEVIDVKPGVRKDRTPGEPLVAVNKVSFRVFEVWKGPERETLVVSAESPPPPEMPLKEVLEVAGTDRVMFSTCAYSFSEGRKYLVYAEGRRMSVNICGETTPLSEASADLEALGDGETPGDSGTLSDTSGGFPRLEIIGMMGLALVSLVLLMRLIRTG
jgi:hypothetical protein